MKIADNKYMKYALCKEMLETVDVIRNFNQAVSKKYVSSIQTKNGVFLTGEASSRFFPAKHAIYQNLKSNCGLNFFSEGALQAMEYNLNDFAVFGSSNSGKTKELVLLLKKLKSENHDTLLSVTAYNESPVQLLAKESTILSCGPENAVAATKSVVEQALFFHSLYANIKASEMGDYIEFSDQFQKTLEIEIDREIVEIVANASSIYFAGRNNGVAEEICLKTSEITHKKSVFLEGTYALHGVEEGLNKQDVMVIFNPFPSEEEKFYDNYTIGIGVEVIAISTRPTRFKTILIPESTEYQSYLELAIGWNLLVEIGIELGIDIDKPVRAKKVGNEFQG